MVGKSVFKTMEGFNHFRVDVGVSLRDGGNECVERKCEGTNIFEHFGVTAVFCRAILRLCACYILSLRNEGGDKKVKERSKHVGADTFAEC